MSASSTQFTHFRWSPTLNASSAWCGCAPGLNPYEKAYLITAFGANSLESYRLRWPRICGRTLCRRHGHITDCRHLELTVGSWCKLCPIRVRIGKQKYRLIARDTKSQRLILGIGSERIAIDFISRISKKPPATGDQPAAV